MFIGIGMGVVGQQPPFQLSSLWPAGVGAGLWYDPSDLTSGYQESTGVTAGAINSPTGLREDKKLGLVLGPELVTNGNFSGGVTTGWNGGNGSILSVVSGEMLVTSAGTAYGYSTQTIATVVGKSYRITVGYRKGSALANSVRVSGISATGFEVGYFPISTDPQTISGSFVATTTATFITAMNGAGLTDTNYFDNISVKPLDGLHSLQATSASRPTLKLDGAIYSDLFDGVDDGYATAAFAAGTLTSNMDCFIAVKRNSADHAITFTDDLAASRYFAVIDPADAAAVTAQGAGTPTYAANGLSVPGGSNTTRSQLADALPVGQWVVLECRNLDLSAWAALRVSSVWPLNGNIGSIVLCPAQTDARRAQIRRALGSRVGLSL